MTLFVHKCRSKGQAGKSTPYYGDTTPGLACVPLYLVSFHQSPGKVKGPALLGQDRDAIIERTDCVNLRRIEQATRIQNFGRTAWTGSRRQPPNSLRMPLITPELLRIYFPANIS